MFWFTGISVSLNLWFLSYIPQRSILGILLFILYTIDKFNILETKIFSYTHDTILYAEVASPSKCKILLIPKIETYKRLNYAVQRAECIFIPA